jgi:hypothetical protein
MHNLWIVYNHPYTNLIPRRIIRISERQRDLPQGPLGNRPVLKESRGGPLFCLEASGHGYPPVPDSYRLPAVKEETTTLVGEANRTLRGWANTPR